MKGSTTSKELTWLSIQLLGSYCSTPAYTWDDSRPGPAGPSDRIPSHVITLWIEINKIELSDIYMVTIVHV